MCSLVANDRYTRRGDAQSSKMPRHALFERGVKRLGSKEKGFFYRSPDSVETVREEKAVPRATRRAAVRPMHGRRCRFVAALAWSAPPQGTSLVSPPIPCGWSARTYSISSSLKAPRTMVACSTRHPSWPNRCNSATHFGPFLGERRSAHCTSCAVPSTRQSFPL